MLLVDLIAGAMVTTGASLLLVGGIGLALTRSEERESETEVARATRTSSDPAEGRATFTTGDEDLKDRTKGDDLFRQRKR